MWRMASTLTLTLVLAMLCTGDAWDLKSDLAPFSRSNASNDVFRYSHHLTCSRDQVIVVRYLQNGYKTRKCLCGTDQQCCQFSYEDCAQLIPPEIFRQVTMECWGKNQCRPLVTKAPDSCQEHGREFPWPAYSQAWYYCVPANTVVDMTRKTAASGYKVTARALPVGFPHGHLVTCSVRTAGYWLQRVLVYVDAVISQGAQPLSCLRLQREMLCRQGRAATDLVAYTPFTFTLQQPANSSMHFAWVTVQEMDSVSRIRVSCEPEETVPPSTARPLVTEAHVAHTTASRTLATGATSREPLTSETRAGGTSTSVPSSPAGGSEPDPKDASPSVTDADVAHFTASRTLAPGTTKREPLTSKTRTGGTSTSVPSSPAGGSEPGQEDASPPVTGNVAVVVAALVAGMVGALAAILVVFIWRRRWRAKKGKLPNQKGHCDMEESPKSRLDVTYKPLVKTTGQTDNLYQRLVLPERVWIPEGDKEESPYDVIEPSHDYELVN